MMIGVGATVPALTNTATGTISATTTGPKGGTATALVIEGTGQIQSTVSGLTGGSLQSLTNAGSITANAVSTDTTITGLAAYGIQDLGGALASVTNSGTISATATLLDNRSQTTIAADLSQNTKAVTFTNTGTVTGDVLFPNAANNVLTIEGANAKLSGQVRSTGLGSVNIGLSTAGTGGILHTSGRCEWWNHHSGSERNAGLRNRHQHDSGFRVGTGLVRCGIAYHGNACRDIADEYSDKTGAFRYVSHLRQFCSDHLDN